MNSRGWALVVAIVMCWVAVASAELTWPDTDLSRRVQGWFAQFSGNEEQAKAYLNANLSKAALTEIPVATRLERRRVIVQRMKGLTPVEVLESSPTKMRVRSTTGGGENAIVSIDAEDAAPHLITAISVAVSAGGGPGGGPPPPAGPPLTDDAAVQEIRQDLDAASTAGAFSGVVLLARGEKVLLRQAWGLSDQAKGVPAAPDMRFNVGSIGKMFTRVALAQLCEAGKVSLDDSLSKYLPDFPHAHEITINMLAEHRSGVGDIFNERYETMDRSKLRHNHDYLDLIRAQPLWFKPGAEQRYSNGGYVLLGEVIAKASGMDYYEYLAKHVFGPAGMKSTSAPIEGDGTPNVARGYTREGATGDQEIDNAATRPWRGSAAGGSYSTVDDLLAFDRAIAANKLCSAKWSAWVTGTPEGDATASFAFAGGAPGIASQWEHDGGVALITLANHDPATVRPVLDPLSAVVRRMVQK